MDIPAQEPVYRKTPRPSILQGVSHPPLLSLTLGELLDQQCQARGDSECLVCPSLGARWTYKTLQEESIQVAHGLLSLGIRAGDRIGILAGNCPEYLSVFFAAGYIGCILVVLNNTYTAQEAKNALKHSGKRLLIANVLQEETELLQVAESCSQCHKLDGRILDHS